MTTAAVEQYTGEGEPPYCEAIFRAADPVDSSPPDLNVDAMIEGARKPNVIKLKKKVVKCVCQVFHREEGINCWRVAFVFFPKKYCQEAEKYYLEATEVNKGFMYTYCAASRHSSELAQLTDVSKVANQNQLRLHKFCPSFSELSTVLSASNTTKPCNTDIRVHILGALVSLGKYKTLPEMSNMLFGLQVTYTPLYTSLFSHKMAKALC